MKSLFFFSLLANSLAGQTFAKENKQPAFGLYGDLKCGDFSISISKASNLTTMLIMKDNDFISSGTAQRSRGKDGELHIGMLSGPRFNQWHLVTVDMENQITYMENTPCKVSHSNREEKFPNSLRFTQESEAH